ncbi:MAG TPA: flagellar biosynthetic protein FliR [Bryobacteraceae bacterium]|nr:flagellar biosynthetic protein FliR [Bryobacteraceae bacterium]
MMLTVPLYGFLFTLTRVSGLLSFVPIPGLNAVPVSARVLLALSLTVCLMPLWTEPGMDVAPEPGALLARICTEFGCGLATGLAVAIVLEAFQVAAQMVGLQAGFSYASTIDPNTQADSSVLQLAAQLFGGSLFFSLGLDRDLVRILYNSIQTEHRLLYSPGDGETLIRLASAMFAAGIRLAMPTVAFLLLVDISFAVLGKIHSQLQLLSLSFSAKMLAGLALLAATLPAFATLLRSSAQHTFTVLMRLLS